MVNNVSKVSSRLRALLRYRNSKYVRHRKPARAIARIRNATLPKTTNKSNTARHARPLSSAQFPGTIANAAVPTNAALMGTARPWHPDVFLRIGAEQNQIAYISLRKFPYTGIWKK